MRTLAMALALTGALAFTTTGATAQDMATADDGPRVIEITILGMVCPFCSYGVQQKMKKVDGIADLDIDLDKGLATLTLADNGDASNELLIRTVKDAGFEVATITRNFESEFPDYDKEAGGMFLMPAA
jgi:copper chaperone CopZ